MVIGDDGGAQVTPLTQAKTGALTTTSLPRSSIASSQTITSPYRIYGAQQDNSTVRILHRTDGGSITEQDWESTAGGESGHIAVDPLDNDIVYGGSYGGFLTRTNHRTNKTQAINVWPDNPIGHGAEGMKYRFQWNFPIFFSPHNPKKLYTRLSNHLHVTYNGGESMGNHQSRPHAQRPYQTRSIGRPYHQRQHQRGVLLHHLCRRIESPYEKDLLWVPAPTTDSSM
jgi:hypothetical protein